MEDSYENQKITKKFCACSFVTDLITKGSRIRCDETNEQFNNKRRLPSYYDPEKFKRGQRLFHKHIYAMFFAKFLGLVTLLSIPDLTQVLKFTQMSNKPYAAYKRYLLTVFHMYIWYNDDFSPKSKSWESIEKVKLKHNSASQHCCKNMSIPISQKNMALTQFGFMGYIVWKTKLVGIHNVKKEEMEDFIHIWRVIGYLMGIEERFNICRESLEETKEICNELVGRVFKPEMQKKHPEFLNMSYALLNGMWCMMPLLEHKTFIQLVANITTKSSKNNNKNNNDMVDVDFQLNIFQKIYMQLIIYFLTLLRFTVFRVFYQYIMYMSLWLMDHFPFLAYYRFGKANSHVEVFS